MMSITKSYNFLCEVKLEELFGANYKGLIYMCDYVKTVLPSCKTHNFCDTLDELEETAFYRNLEELDVIEYRIVDTEKYKTLWKGWEVI